jgi:hypothetical protein
MGVGGTDPEALPVSAGHPIANLLDMSAHQAHQIERRNDQRRAAVGNRHRPHEKRIADADRPAIYAVTTKSQSHPQGSNVQLRGAG